MKIPLQCVRAILAGALLVLAVTAGAQDLKLKGQAKDAAPESAVPDDANPPSRVRRPSAAKPVAAIQLDRRAGEPIDDAWDRYFAVQSAKFEKSDDRAILRRSEGEVRQTVREF